VNSHTDPNASTTTLEALAAASADGLDAKRSRCQYTGPAGNDGSVFLASRQAGPASSAAPHGRAVAWANVTEGKAPAATANSQNTSPRIVRPRPQTDASVRASDPGFNARAQARNGALRNAGPRRGRVIGRRRDASRSTLAAPAASRCRATVTAAT